VTTAQWMRNFIQRHPAYQQDSVVSQEVAHSLMLACAEVGEGRRQARELLGDTVIDPVDTDGAYEARPRRRRRCCARAPAAGPHAAAGRCSESGGGGAERRGGRGGRFRWSRGRWSWKSGTRLSRGTRSARRRPRRRGAPSLLTGPTTPTVAPVPSPWARRRRPRALTRVAGGQRRGWRRRRRGAWSRRAGTGSGGWSR